MADDDKEKPGVRFTAEIRVNKIVRRTDLPEFCIDHMGEVTDMRPFALEVLATYPDPVAIDVETLALLCVKSESGKYIRVGEYPAGVDRGIVSELMNRMRRWMDWPRLEKGLLDTSRFFPDRRFHCDEAACDAAKRMNGHLVSQHAPERIPLDTCWGRICNCRYHLVKRDGSEV